MLSKFHVYHLLSQEQKFRAHADQLKSRRKNIHTVGMVRHYKDYVKLFYFMLSEFYLYYLLSQQGGINVSITTVKNSSCVRYMLVLTS